MQMFQVNTGMKTVILQLKIKYNTDNVDAPTKHRNENSNTPTKNQI